MIVRGIDLYAYDPQDAAYGFVDADNLKFGLEQTLRAQGLTENELDAFDLHSILTNIGSKRFFFYSAVETGADTPEWIEKFQSAERFIFRSGILTTKNGKRKQEGVDVLLAIDAVSHAHRKTMQTCIIFSADGDLLPLVNELVSLGVTTIVCNFSNPSKSSVCGRLRDAADHYWRIGYEILRHSAKPDYRPRTIGSISESRLPNGIPFLDVGETKIAFDVTSGLHRVYFRDDDRRQSFFELASETGAKIWSKLLSN